MFKYIIFDLDGTLLNTKEGIVIALKDMIKAFNFKELPLETVERFIGPPLSYSLKRTYDNVSDELAIECTKYFEKAYGENISKVKTFPNMKEVLTKLKQNGYKTGIATYKREDQTLELMEMLGLSDCFDVICGSHVDKDLTKADIILNAINKFGCDKKEALMIGDTIHDQGGALKADVKFLAVTYGFGFDKNNPPSDCDFINNPLEIFDYVKKS